MSSRWWNPFDGMEQMAFKPMEGGYLYRAPNPWLFGPGRYHLINESQKAALMAHHRRTLQLTFWSIIVAVIVGVPFAGHFGGEHGWITLGLSGLIGLAIGFALNLELARKVAPLVAGLPTTAARITQRDAFKTLVAVYPLRTVVILALIDLALFAIAVSTAVFGPNGWDVYAVVGTVLFGSGMVYFAVLCLAKHRQAAA